MRKSRFSQTGLIVVVLLAGFSSASLSIIQVYAYSDIFWPGPGGCSYWYYYSWYCPYYSYVSYYPYYYGFSYPYSYGYSYYFQPTKFQLTVSVNPSNIQPNFTGAGAYDQGATATFATTQSIIQISTTTRYIFSHWTGDYSGLGPSGTLTMDSPKTVTAVYQMQYFLSINTPQNVSSIQGGGWYNAGDSATLAAPAIIIGGTDRRLAFSDWSLDGVNVTTNSTLTVLMDTPHTVNAEYKQQYHLTVTSDLGATTGTGWYDAGSQAAISATTPPSPAYGINMIFNGWNGTVSSPANQSTTVLMDGPKIVTATWRADATVLYATGAAAVILVIVAAYLLTLRRKKAVGPDASTRRDA